MVNASFGVLDTDLPANFKFRNNRWIHIVCGQEITAILTFLGKRKIKNINVIDGTVVDYKTGYQQKTISPKGKAPYVSKTPIPVPVDIPFQIINKKYVKTLIHSDMTTVLQNLNMVVPSKSFFHYVYFNIENLNNDYPNQWFADIFRGGHHAETIKAKGSNLEKDDKIGGEDYKKYLKNDIGITEKINGFKTQIRINRNGLTQIPDNNKLNYQPTGNEYVEFFVNTLLPYVGIGKRAGKPKNK